MLLIIIQKKSCLGKLRYESV